MHEAERTIFLHEWGRKTHKLEILREKANPQQWNVDSFILARVRGDEQTRDMVSG